MIFIYNHKIFLQIANESILNEVINVSMLVPEYYNGSGMYTINYIFKSNPIHVLIIGKKGENNYVGILFTSFGY